MSDVIEIHPRERAVCAKCGEHEPFGLPLLLKINAIYYGVFICHFCTLEHASKISDRLMDVIGDLSKKLHE